MNIREEEAEAPDYIISEDVLPVFTVFPPNMNFEKGSDQAETVEL